MGRKAHYTLQQWILLYNANRELKDYAPKQEIYMAEARRKQPLRSIRKSLRTASMIPMAKKHYLINVVSIKQMMKMMNLNGSDVRIKG